VFSVREKLNFLNSTQINLELSIVNRLWVGRPRNRGSFMDNSKTLLSSPQHPDRFWGPPSLLSNGYRGYFPKG
jgi:hypothetical protein